MAKHEAMLYLLRQRVCARFNHAWEPSSVNSGILEQNGYDEPISIFAEECIRCHAYKLIIAPAG